MISSPFQHSQETGISEKSHKRRQPTELKDGRTKTSQNHNNSAPKMSKLQKDIQRKFKCRTCLLTPEHSIFYS